MPIFWSAGVFKIRKYITNITSNPTQQIFKYFGLMHLHSPVHVGLAGGGHQHGHFGAAWVTRGKDLGGGRT